MGNGEGGRGSQTAHISYLAFPAPIPMPFTILPFTLTASIGLISLKKNNFISAALFFVHFFAVVLHDYHVKLPVARFMEEMLYVFRFTFFLPPLIFTLVAASISHFLTAAIKFSCFSSNEIGLCCCCCNIYLFLALALSLCSTLMQTLILV